MKDWKIHLAWALAVPLVAFLWGRWTATGPEPAPRAGVAQVGGGPRVPEQAPGRGSAPAGTPVPPVAAIPPETEDILTELRRLLQSRKKEERWEATIRIYRVPDGPEKKELLLLELASPDHSIRSSGLNELIRLLGPDAVPLLHKLLKSEPEAYLRRSAAEVLGTMGGSGTLEALLGAVHDPERYVQCTAAGALGRLGQSGPAEELVPRVSADLSSPDGAVRREAAKDLTLLRSPSTIPILLGCLRDSDGGVRLQAAMGLGEQDSPGLLPALEALRKDPDPGVVEAAENAITRYQRKKH